MAAAGGEADAETLGSALVLEVAAVGEELADAEEVVETVAGFEAAAAAASVGASACSNG